MLNFESEFKSTLLLFFLNKLHIQDLIVDCCSLVCVQYATDVRDSSIT